MDRAAIMSIRMHENNCLVRLISSELAMRLAMAPVAEIHGDHLTFLSAKGELAALFSMEVVERWSEIHP